MQTTGGTKPVLIAVTGRSLAPTNPHVNSLEPEVINSENVENVDTHFPYLIRALVIHRLGNCEIWL